MYLNYKISQNLNALMKQKGFNNLEQFIDQSIKFDCKISRPTVQRVLDNKDLQSLTLQTIIKIAKVLDCEVYDVIEIKKED